MRSKTLFVCAVASSVVMSALVAPLSTSICRGDVNGDHRVNIFDVQSLVSQMVAGAIPADGADVNSDGQIDVCDLQFILARLNTQTPSEEPTPAGKTTPPGILLSVDHFWLGVDKGVAAILRPNTDETRSSLRFHDEPLTVLSSRTERYLYTLTENAPPFPA